MEGFVTFTWDPGSSRVKAESYRYTCVYIFVWRGIRWVKAMEMYERLGSLISKRMEDEVRLLDIHIHMQFIGPRRFEAAAQSEQGRHMMAS